MMKTKAISSARATQNWGRRRGYTRLGGESVSGVKTGSDITTLSSTSTPRNSTPKRRSSWKLKIKRKLRFLNFRSPKKFLTRLRDGYVNMMLGLANSRAFSTGYGYGCTDSIGSYSFGNRPLKEYDEKRIIEIYRSLMAEKRFVPCDVVDTSLFLRQ